MKMKPLQDRLIVKRLEDEKVTAGGIIIPDAAKEKPAEAKIVAVGVDVSKTSGLKKGVKVLFGKYSGTEVAFEGEDYLILKEEDILAIIG